MSETPTTQSDKKRWLSLVVLSLALAIIVIDTTLLNVSISTIIKELHTDIVSLQWVITAYALTLSALTITGGRLGDLWGRKKMFVAGAAIFALGSLLASYSNNIPTLLAGESIIEGIGAALMMPATASLLVANFQGRERAIAFGVWGGIAAAAAAIGPILGGYLTTHYSWRWGFRINVFVAAVLILGSIIIKESRDEEEKPTLDIVGVFLSSIGLVSVVFGIIESSTYGWWGAKQLFAIGDSTLDLWGLSIVPFAILIGSIILGLFLLWESYIEEKGQTPLVSMKIFSNYQFTSGVITTMILSLSQTGIIFTLPVFLQSVRGLDAFHTGLSLLPMSLSILVAAPFSVLLTKKFTAKRIIQTGLILNTLAVIVLSRLMNVNSTALELSPGLILYGAGMGLVMASVSNLTLSAVPVDQAGEASGINSTLRQVGSSLGSAIIGAVLVSGITTNMVDNVNQSTIIPPLLKTRIVETVAKQSSNLEFGGEAQFTGQIPAPVRTELSNLVKKSTTDSNKVALLYASVFSFLVILVSTRLPNVKNLEAKSRGGH